MLQNILNQLPIHLSQPLAQASLALRQGLGRPLIRVFLEGTCKRG
jgi:hypothetical protein